MGRPDSLRRTINLLTDERCAAHAELLIVDNAPTPSLQFADVDSRTDFPVRLLHEPRAGKAFAADCGVDAAHGELIAILDDDMSPAPGWIDAVVGAAQRRPDADIFAGRSHIIWPDGIDAPAWASDPLARGIAFSVIDPGPDADREMGNGIIEVPSGNHFWFRRLVRDHVPSFPRVWAPEADFVIAARLHGHRGIFVPDVVCGHRIQARLIDDAVLLKRARAFGHVKSRLDRLRTEIAGTEPSRLRSMLARVKHAATWIGARATMPKAEHARTTDAINDAVRAMVRLGRVEERLFGHRITWCPRFGESVMDASEPSDPADMPDPDRPSAIVRS